MKRPAAQKKAPPRVRPAEELPAPAARLMEIFKRAPEPADQPGPALAVGRLSFCHHPFCERGAPALRAEVSRLADEADLEVEIVTTLTVCDGACHQGPWVGMPERGLFYRGLQAKEAGRLLEETVRHGRMLIEHLYVEPTKVTDSRVVWEPEDKLIVAIEPGMCLLDIAAYLFFFNAAQSCGKCTPCRLGVSQVARLLNRLRLGGAEPGDVAKLQEVVDLMSEAAFCAFAPKVSLPLRVALAAARHEFERHEQSPCPERPLTGDTLFPEDPPAERGPWVSRDGLNRTFQGGVRCALDRFCLRPTVPPLPGGET